MDFKIWLNPWNKLSVCYVISGQTNLQNKLLVYSVYVITKGESEFQYLDTHLEQITCVFSPCDVNG